MKVSVIVPCRNEYRHVREFLDSVLEQELGADQEFEILIADGMSTDGTREVLEEYCAHAPCVRVIDNPGLIVSTGLNEAIRSATGDVIVRMDGHTVYAKNYIRECVRALEESGADNVGGPWVAKGRGTMGEAIAAAFRSPFCAGGGKAHDPAYEGEVDTVYLGCWRRAAFDKAGLFDPELVRNQDDELNFRLRRKGGRIWQSPRIQSVYTPRGSLSALFRQYMQYGYWKVAVMRKHGGLASWRQAVPGMFVASLFLFAAAIAIAALTGRMDLARMAAGAAGIELAIYALASIAAALSFAGQVPFRVLAAIPPVIATYHVSYGLGFLIGLFQPPKSRRAESTRFFTASTR